MAWNPRARSRLLRLLPPATSGGVAQNPSHAISRLTCGVCALLAAPLATSDGCLACSFLMPPVAEHEEVFGKFMVVRTSLQTCQPFQGWLGLRKAEGSPWYCADPLSTHSLGTTMRLGFVRRAITSLSGSAIYHSHIGIRVHSEYQEVLMMIFVHHFKFQTLKYF